jgi:flagellar hook-basal body complex protein FliE
MSVGGLTGADRVMAIRAQILERNAALQRATTGAAAPAAGGIASPAAPPATGFAGTLETALQSVNRAQSAASAASEAYERGETVDVAQVMLSRQKASLAFEATLQARNKILSAYKDIMSMPV